MAGDKNCGVWPRRPKPDGRIIKNCMAENKQPDGRTERLNYGVWCALDSPYYLDREDQVRHAPELVLNRF